MSDRIIIKHSDVQWLTTGTLEQVQEDINEGREIVVWGYNPNGTRWEERIVFYGPPDFVITDNT